MQASEYDERRDDDAGTSQREERSGEETHEEPRPIQLDATPEGQDWIRRARKGGAR